MLTRERVGGYTDDYRHWDGMAWLIQPGVR